MIKVMLVDDQNLVRKGVRSLLELSEEIEVIAEAPDGIEAIRTIPEIGPDVVLLDMRMPGKSGLDVLQQLSSDGTLPPTIILTTFDDDEMVLAGIKAGAKGFLLKDVSLEELVNAIRTVADGGSMVKPAVTQRLLKGLENMHTDFSSLDRTSWLRFLSPTCWPAHHPTTGTSIREARSKNRHTRESGTNASGSWHSDGSPLSRSRRWTGTPKSLRTEAAAIACAMRTTGGVRACGPTLVLRLITPRIDQWHELAISIPPVTIPSKSVELNYTKQVGE